MKLIFGILFLSTLAVAASDQSNEQEMLVLAGNDTAEITISRAKTMGECTVKYNEIIQRLEITNRIILHAFACRESKTSDGKIDSYYARIFVGKF